jgi:HprK-related kinase A
LSGVTTDPSSTPTVGTLSGREFEARRRGRGLGVRLGPFAFNVRIDVGAIHDPLYRLYRDYPLLNETSVFSGHVRLATRRAWSPFRQATVRFSVDGRVPHEDLPIAHALPALEWGLNLVIALRTHSLLMLHSGAVARSGKVMLFPAWPGSGKTTLCAALVHRGWRLFSDEFGLVDPAKTWAIPFPRPMPLKNESIEVIRAFAPEAEWGPTIRNTRKGDVAHVKAPLESIRDADRVAPVGWIVFPRWTARAPLALEPMPKAEAFFTLATNAFNYEVLGESAFSAVQRLIDATPCYSLVYSDLAEAVRRLNDLSAADHG